MKKIVFCLILTAYFLLPNTTSAQINENQTGAWYMYFWNTTLKESRFGFQGDIQYRNWDIMGDLEQLLLRGGITYKPEKANIKFTLGYGYVLSGEFGDSNDTSDESRIYQEALLPHKLADRFYLTHRFRFEQRWVENQDFRTRFRYNLFLNIPVNQVTLNKGAIYLALYNELFINGQKDIGNGDTVEIFDRNRLYTAVGYSITDNLKVQAGYMRQSTNAIDKGQLQLSLHHTL
ncbi:DUF2490 domain-containing protein [Sinomicrobium weinanense]|uniref:DUF2490 domain-containing protein n=1 Tax=Sinomicrobium weinanense TaxID=2842200 RepID=A0A926JVM8_9FLAO|nr:DUF2490 domain-containing protein [Sinomicrobium weinanense]MBC9798211.1 DUF2490 domain-containing protein [Sinomicrobium weinanense]MBU3122869.1 DUF2490 domain-containing protein [Sinomicrobium weinanense]